MNVVSSGLPHAAEPLVSGTGITCPACQCDGVPCAEVTVDCERCQRGDRAAHTAAHTAASGPSRRTETIHA